MVLLQNSDNLFLGKSALPHRLCPQVENRLTFKRGQFLGAGQVVKSRRAVHCEPGLVNCLGNISRRFWRRELIARNVANPSKRIAKFLFALFLLNLRANYLLLVEMLRELEIQVPASALKLRTSITG
jgi:hypothetical protein